MHEELPFYHRDSRIMDMLQELFGVVLKYKETIGFGECEKAFAFMVAVSRLGQDEQGKIATKGEDEKPIEGLSDG